jgi:hypothetical protein
MVSSARMTEQCVYEKLFLWSWLSRVARRYQLSLCLGTTSSLAGFPREGGLVTSTAGAYLMFLGVYVLRRAGSRIVAWPMTSPFRNAFLARDNAASDNY